MNYKGLGVLRLLEKNYCLSGGGDPAFLYGNGGGFPLEVGNFGRSPGCAGPGSRENSRGLCGGSVRPAQVCRNIPGSRSRLLSVSVVHAFGTVRLVSV